MKKKFLDKQGLAELDKNLKEKYVSKVDNEQTVNTVKSLDMKRQIQEMGEKIVQNVQDIGAIDYMVLTGQYLIQQHQFANDIPLSESDEIWSNKVRQGHMKLSQTLSLTVTKTENDGKYQIKQNVYDPLLGVQFTRWSKLSSEQYSDEEILNFLNKASNVTDLWSFVGYDAWTPWKTLSAFEYSLTPFTKDLPKKEYFSQKYGLLSIEDKKKLDELQSSRSATFVIANYDSSENSKAGADYVIKENESFCDVINSFVKKLPFQGGKIQLTEGNFVEWKNKSVNLTTPNTVIEGYGRSTLLCRRGETKSVDFIRVDGTQIVVKNIQIQEPDRVGVVLTPESIGCTLENIYCQGQSGGAFIIDGKNHSILNCSACKDSDKYGFSIKIIGENHNIQSCSVFIAIDVCSAFALENANSVNLLNCQVQSKRKDLSEITGFNLRYTNKCNFTNCQCSTYAGVAFNLDDSSDNTFFNCVTTIEVVENLSYYIGSSSSTESSKYNVFNNCRATVTAEMEGDELPAPPFHLDKNTKHNVITSCVLSNLIVADYGSDNVATNNVQLGAHL